MSEMVERVARAIKLDDGSPCISRDKGRNKLCAHSDGCICRSLARAAIAAMREPTSAMREAAQTDEISATQAWLAWEAMIDEALR